MLRELPRLTDVFEAYRGQVVAAYLFGSLASETATALSDVDIAVQLVEDLEEVEINRLETDLFVKLAQRLRTDELDLIILNRAPLRIRYGVFKECKILYCANQNQMVDFECDTIMEYLDYKPFLEEFDREFLRQLG